MTRSRRSSRRWWTHANTWRAGLLALLLMGALLVGPTVLRAQNDVAAPAAGPRFAYLDVYVDATTPLAAYQIEVSPEKGRFVITGVEGGEHELFAQPPYYDRNVIDRGKSDHVIIGAFTTAEAKKLPRGKTRVARLHLFIEDGAAVTYAAKIQTAGTYAGKPIKAKVIVEEGIAE